MSTEALDKVVERLFDKKRLNKNLRRDLYREIFDLYDKNIITLKQNNKALTRRKNADLLDVLTDIKDTMVQVFQGKIFITIVREDKKKPGKFYRYEYPKPLLGVSKIFGFYKNDQVIKRGKDFDTFLNRLEDDEENDGAILYSQILTLISVIDSIRIADKIPFKEVEKQNPEDVKLSSIKKQYIPNMNLPFHIHKDAKNINEIFQHKIYSLDYTNDLLEKYNLKNSCLFLLIIDTFKKSFERKWKRNQRKNTDFTAEWLYKEMLKTEWDYKDVVLSFNDVLPFFEKHGLSIICLKMDGSMFFEYKAMNSCKYNKSLMRCIYDDKHVYRITDQIKTEEFMKKVNSEVDYDKIVPTNYILPKPYKKRDYILCKNENEVSDAIKERKQDIIFDGDMNILLEKFMQGHYCQKPQIRTIKNSTCEVESFSFIIEATFFTISKALASYVVENPELSIEYIEKFEEIKSYYKSLIIDKSNLSYYNDEYKTIFKTLMPSIVRGSLEDVDYTTSYSFDINKFYYNTLINMPFFPVCNPLNQINKYDGEKIIDHYLYVCNTEKTSIFIQNSQFSTFGYNLKKLKVPYKIDYVLEMEKMPNSLKDELPKIWNSDLTDDHKKLIPNLLSGIIGKNKNIMTKSYLFDNLNDCYDYEQAGYKRYTVKENIYLCVKKISAELNNGFLPIRHLLLDCNRIKLMETYDMLTDKGYKVQAINTDAFFVEKLLPNYEKLLSDKFGGLKLENKQPPQRRYKETDFSENIKPTFTNIKEQKCINEYSKGEIHKRIENKTLLYGVAGSGKSSSAFSYALKKFSKDEILCVCYQNSTGLSIHQKYNVKACTLHSLLGMKKDGDQGKKSYDITDIKCIVFDEVCMLEYGLIFKLYNFMKSNEHLFYLATGDMRQLAIENNSVHNKITYIKRIFPNVINLFINKRICEEDREKLERIQKKLFINKLNPYKVLCEELKENFVNTLDNLKYGFSYTNSTRTGINRIYNNKLDAPKNINGWKYVIGMNLICKHTLKSKNIYNNNTYKVKNIEDNVFELEDILSDEIYKLTQNDIMNFFEMDNCKTVHSAQGFTIDDCYFICDASHPFVDANWVNVAITRATSLKNVCIYNGKHKESVNMKVFEKMAVSYYQQDIKANRTLTNFITPQEIQTIYNENKRCYLCGVHTLLENGAQRFTLDRINNNLCHTKDNCKTCCKACNIAKK